MTHPAEASPPRSHTARPWPSAALLTILTLAILATFARLFASEFSWWDDQQTLHQNPLFNPPTLETLRTYWTRPFMGLYVPVTYTVWAAIAKAAYVGIPDEFNVALNPLLFHATSIALHVGSTALVFAILRRLLDAPVPAFFGAMLFAVHPLQVEALAWVSGMKDLLCWFGTLAVVWVYVRRVRVVQATGRPLWNALAMPVAALALALAILCKPTAIVAPAALLAIDGLVLRRQWLRALRDLLPLVAIAAIGATIARIVQTVETVEQVALWRRPFVVGDTLLFYLEKFAWPFSLAIDYGQTPAVVLARGRTYVIWVIPAAIAAWLLWRHRSLPFLALAGALVVIGIAPVSGLATFQMQVFSTPADHYLYFSLVGPALALAWTLRQWPSTWLRIAVTIVLVAFAARSFDQCGHWRDTFALFEQTMHVNPLSVAAQNNLAAVELRRQVPRLDEAERHARRAIELQPDSYYALQTFGVVEGQLVHGREATEAFDKLWTLCEIHHVAPNYRLEVARAAFAAMLACGDYAKAYQWARRAFDISPDEFQSRGDLAYAVRKLNTQRALTRPSATQSTTTRASG